jgi:SAM-dependent methyltransferase
LETHFLDVTELAGEPITSEQLARLEHRYTWAAQYCRGRDVAEIACGTGPGLGLLAQVAKSLEAGDISEAILDIARRHYGDRVALRRIDALALPFASASRDVILLFEAIYYLPDADRFVAECRRVLRPGGVVLIATANKDLSDFNPSPHSHRYYGAVELAQLFGGQGFEVELFGHLSVREVGIRQRVLRPVKRVAVELGLMPRTMRGKRLLKRLVFGRPVFMPAELTGSVGGYRAPTRVRGEVPDRDHKVLYATATLPRAD